MDLDSIFTSIDLDRIDEYIRDQQEENLHLDFKIINSANLTRDDRKIFAKCVSGFANSSGGIIVWGVDARKNANEVDSAVGKIPISPLSLFISRITTLTGQVVEPIVDGIIHKRVDESSDSGYAVTLVPMSVSGPHMAKSGEDRYFKRSGDSFYRMEHFDLEDMFGRRAKPSLDLTYKIKFKNFIKLPTHTECTFLIYLGISNTGRGSAKTPYLSLSIPEPFSIYRYGLDGNGNFGLPRLTLSRGKGGFAYGASSKFVIHPGTTLDVTAIVTKVTMNDTGVSLKDDLHIQFSLGAEDVRLKDGYLHIQLDELRDALPSSA